MFMQGEQVRAVMTAQGLQKSDLYRVVSVSGEHRVITLQPWDDREGVFLFIDSAELVKSTTPVGFELWNTGGGCMAYRRAPDGAGYEVLITSVHGGDVPEDPCSDCMIGIYDTESGELLVERESVCLKAAVAWCDEWESVNS